MKCMEEVARKVMQAACLEFFLQSTHSDPPYVALSGPVIPSCRKFESQNRAPRMRSYC